MDIGREECVSDILADILNLLDNLGDRFQVVNCDEFDAIILPVRSKRPARGNYNLRPVAMIHVKLVRMILGKVGRTTRS